MSTVALDDVTHMQVLRGQLRLPRRLVALLRLVALRRRCRRLEASLYFADPRVRGDIGLPPQRHRSGWIESFIFNR